MSAGQQHGERFGAMRFHRRSITARLCLTAGSALLFAGCHAGPEAPRKTIQDLYQEALVASANHGDVIQPRGIEAEPAVFKMIPPSATDNAANEESVIRRAEPEEIINPNEQLPAPAPRKPKTPLEGFPKLTIPNDLSSDDAPPATAINGQEITRRARPKPLPVVIPASVSAAAPYTTDEQAAESADNPADPIVSEIFEETEIQQALRILEAQANVTILFDDKISGIVNTNISNEPLSSALDKILLPQGYIHVKRKNHYIVSSADPDSPFFAYIAKRYRFEPLHQDADKLAALIPPRFKKYYQVAQNNANVIIIDAPQEIGDELLTRLRELDQPIQQVVLEAIVCVVAPDSGFRFGFDWSQAVSVSGTDKMKIGLTGLAFEGKASREGMRDAFSDFAVTSAFVKLLAQEGYITIRAAPRVTAKDGEKANISIARETFFSLQPSASNVLFRQDVQKVEAGISLEIVPRIRGNVVSVQIDKAEVSEDIRTNDTRESITTNPYPIISRRQVSTKVNVPDGHTIVIGGLVQRQTVDRESRIPVLGDIPFAGHLFRTVEKQEQDAEVAIFISPRIVPAEACYP